MAASDHSDRPNSPNPQYKREAERIPIPGELHGEIMVFQPITVTEISRGGLQIETVFPLQLE